MRRIITLLIFFTSTSLAVFAQPERRIFLKKISEDASTVLSISSVERFEKLSSYDYYKEAYIVRISSVKESLQNGRLVMDMPGKSGRRIDLRTKYSFASSINESQWFGEFSDGDALLIDKDGHSFGHVRIGKNNYDIHYLENGYAGVFLIDSEFIKQTECGTVHVPGPEKSVDESEPEFSMMSSSQPIVRVLVLYTQAAQNSGYNIPNVVQLAFSQFVTASINSNVVVGLHLAGIEFLDFIENNNNAQSDVIRLRDDATAQQLRNSYEADLVMLLTGNNYGLTRGVVVSVGPDEQNAYGLIQIGYASSSSTYTFVHELAHLFGARHENTSDNTPGDAHAHGWQTGFIFTKKYGTVVHTEDVTNRTRLLYFSNPYISHNGNPTGVLGQSFNARVINVNGWIVQDFRQSGPAFSTTISGPGSANGGDILSFFANPINGQSPYSYQWQVNTGSGYYVAGSSYNLNIVMPNDNDMEVFLTVTDANNQQATAYNFVHNTSLGGGCTVCQDEGIQDSIPEEVINQLNDVESLLIYPNPSSSQLNLIHKTQSNQVTKVQIMHPSGRVIYQTELYSNYLGVAVDSIDISHLKSGTYYLKYFKSNIVKTLRFVKN